MNGFVEVCDEVFLPWAEAGARVVETQLRHSLGREDRIPCGTKVLHVASDDLHVIRIKHEVVKGCATLQSKDGIVDIIACARVGLADVTVDDGIFIFFEAIVVCFEGGALACFEMHVLVVIVVLEVGDALLLLEFDIALPVLVAGVGTGLATGDEVRHRVGLIGRFFSLERGEAPVFGLGGSAHGRHA